MIPISAPSSEARSLSGIQHRVGSVRADDDERTIDEPSTTMNSPTRTRRDRRWCSTRSTNASELGSMTNSTRCPHAEPGGVVADFVAAVVGLVEARPLERDADRQEHLLDRHRLAGLGVDVLGQRVVGERLLDLDGLAGVDELVHVGRHGSATRLIARSRRAIAGDAVARRIGPRRRDPRRRNGDPVPPGHQGSAEGVDADRRPRPRSRSSSTRRSAPGSTTSWSCRSRASRRSSEYFDADDALVDALRRRARTTSPIGCARIGRDWRVTIVYQDDPQGLGHAVGCAREAVGDEPFAVLLPDELMGDSSLLAQMNGVCACTGGSVVGVKQVPRDPGQLLRRARAVGPDSDADGVIPVADLVEKPPVDEAPSDYILIGRYVLTARRVRRDRAPDPGQWRRAPADRCVAGPGGTSPFSRGACRDIGRYDTGNPVGFLEAAIDLRAQAIPRCRRPTCAPSLDARALSSSEPRRYTPPERSPSSCGRAVLVDIEVECVPVRVVRRCATRRSPVVRTEPARGRTPSVSTSIVEHGDLGGMRRHRAGAAGSARVW